MPLSEAQRKANDKYIKEHYRQVKLSMPNEEADELEAYCKEHGHTKAGFIRQAVKDKIAEKDTADKHGIQIGTDSASEPPALNDIEPPESILARLRVIQSETPSADSIIREIWETQHYISSALWCNVFYDSKVYGKPKDAEAVRAALIECKERIDGDIDSLIRNIDRQQQSKSSRKSKRKSTSDT